MEEILNIVIKVAATLLAFGIGWLGTYVTRWIRSKLDKESQEAFDLFITELVSAAEQMYKGNDPDGTVRLAYVESMLRKAGYDITDAVKALIESKVFEINLVSKGSASK